MNMNRVSIISLFVFATLGCTTLPKEYTPVGHPTGNVDSDCQELYEEISDKWGFHQIFSSCYYFNEKLVSAIVENQDCFIGNSEEEIIQFFGKPTFVRQKNLTYSMSKNCTEIDTSFSTNSLKFKITGGVVREVKYTQAAVLYQDK